MDTEKKTLVKQLEDFAAKNEFQKLIATYEAYSNGNVEGEELIKAKMYYGFGLYMLGMVAEAKDIFEDFKDSPVNKRELYFLLNYLYQSLKEYEQSIDAGMAYLELLKKPDDFPGELLIQDDHLKAHEIYNNIGTCYTKMGRVEDAVQNFYEGLKFNDSYCLLYENLGILLVQNGEYAAAEEVLVKGKEKFPENPELPRILGLAYERAHYYKDSETELLKAIELGSKEALYDICLLYTKLMKFHKIKFYLEKFIHHYPENEEAKKLLDDISKSPYLERKEPEISVCMIVKDEEEMLPRCLESVRDIADELIVVDTGSTDRTVEIAESFGAKIYHHPWKDSFSEARNHTLEHATKEWIFSIDADEELERADIPRIMMARWQENYDAILVAIYSSLPGQLGGVSRGKHYYPRMYKRREDIYYYGIVHNLLKMPEKSAMSDIRLYHYGYDLDQERMWKKFKRSLSLLLQQIEENPDDAFARFNTAQMYLSRNFNDEAEEHARAVLEILSPEDIKQQHIYLMCVYQLALIYFRRGELEEGKKFCLKALKVKKDYIDPLLALGSYYLVTGKYKQAISTYKKFLKYRAEQLERDSYSFIILNKVGADYEAYYGMSEAYIKLGQTQKASEFLEKAKASNPHFWLIYKTEGDIALASGDYQRAFEVYEQGIKLGYLNAEKYGTLSAGKKQYSELLEKYKEAAEKVISEGKNK